MTIALTGASGFLGRCLRQHLAAQGHDLRCMSRHAPSEPGWFHWDALSGVPPREALEGADAVIHLAGEPVAQRWDPEVKRCIRVSRTQGTHALVEALAALSRRPEVLVSASAIGYYGDRGEELLGEDAAPGGDFLAEVCVEWERAARLAEEAGIRVVCLRIGVVLSPRGGALAKMLLPFRLGLGGPIAGGRAWMSWIHVDDLARLFAWAVDNQDLRGPVNAVSPGAVQNKEFTRHLARTLHRPAIVPAPAFALRLAYGEMAGVVLASTRVAPAKATHLGFQFNWPELSPALGSLIS